MSSKHSVALTNITERTVRGRPGGNKAPDRRPASALPGLTGAGVEYVDRGVDAVVAVVPRVLVRNPGLWYRLHADARKSPALGTLLCGATALDRDSERKERETAETVFKVSGLE
jgi:hypothetical protein